MYKVDVLMLVEPRISGEVADKVIRKLCFDDHTKVDANGFSGGIWILWKSSIGKIQVLETNGQFISVSVTNGDGKNWFLTVVYASPTPSIRELLWAHLRGLSTL